MDGSILTTIEVLLFLCGSPFVVSTNFRREYYTAVTFPCTSGDIQDGGQNSKALVGRVWSLPDRKDLVSEKESIVNKNVLLSNESFDLTIQHITDVNFGVYICIKVWNDSSISIVRHGLNLDGPVYDSLHDRYKNSAIVGGVAAGVVLLLVLLAYVVWHFFCSEKRKRERRLAEDLAKGVDRYSTHIYDNVGLELYTKKSTT